MSEAFAQIARLEAEALGMANLAIVVVRHPFADLRPSEVSEVAEGALESVVAGLTSSGVKRS